MLVVTGGALPTARAFDVKLWNPPPNDPDFDSETLLERFIEELLTALTQSVLSPETTRPEAMNQSAEPYQKKRSLSSNIPLSLNSALRLSDVMI